jgi:hypothetical protein
MHLEIFPMVSKSWNVGIVLVYFLFCISFLSFEL